MNNVNGQPLTITNSNRLLLQKPKVQPFYETKKNTLRLSLTGYGPCLVQFSAKFNKKEEIKPENKFELSVEAVDKDECNVVTLNVQTRFCFH